jgi:hypothetical protein
MTTDPTAPGPVSPGNQGGMGPGLPSEPATAEEPTPGAPRVGPADAGHDAAGSPGAAGTQGAALDDSPPAVGPAERAAGILGGVQRSVADILARLRGGDDVPREYLVERLEHIEHQLEDAVGRPAGRSAG